MKRSFDRAVITAALLATLAAAQDRRVTPIAVGRKQALVIGNSAYTRAPLKNPLNDAAGMESTLRQLGFEVRTLRNLDLQHMESAIDEFTASLSAGSLAFFYFSGHGVQVNYMNYLLPVDFAATSETDVKYKAYPATRIQEKMESSNARLRVLVLDACRNNPFRYKRDAMAGLAPMPVNAEGTLIAFSTGDNNTADDNAAQAYGLYTKYLMPALLTPGLQLHETFQKAKEDVFTASRRTQNPSIYENVVGVYYLISPPSRTAGDVEAWELVRGTNDPRLLEQFLAEYPSSGYAGAARLRLATLRPRVDTRPLLETPPTAHTRPNQKDGLMYAWIPPGTFTMGCSPGDNQCEADEKPAAQITISRGFWIGTTEVPQDAYQRIAGNNPSKVKGGRLPVHNVSWNDAQGYCRAVGMRLPTEAEWEYAARAGNPSARYGPAASMARYSGNSATAPQEVGQKQPNGFGLYDTLGNVWEWVADWYDGYSKRTATRDPKGPATGTFRVRRGGAWYNDEGKYLRVSYRAPRTPTDAEYDVGFRCAGE
jgi:formylglycine-generating enzyme required for sulfatase activity